ncbi:MAG: type II secretion system F family protein [Erysipelotrichaceae bacterium]|nr:type II secretion system F family protein [Erysipelotrichaceae bacterium]
MSKQTKLDYLGVSAFAESMGMMIQAGISIDEAIHLLKQGDHKEGILGQALNKMGTLVEEGETLDKAMQDTGVFPDYAINMVHAGLSTGKLEDVMFHLASYYNSEKQMSDKIRSAILYPASMITMIIAILIIMLVMVLPAFRDVYDKLTGSLTASSYNYIGFAYALCRVLLVIMIVLVIVLVCGVLMWNSGKRETVENFLRKIPLCNNLLDTLAMFRFTAAYDMYLSSGEMQDDALKHSTEMVNYRPVEEKLEKCAARMEEGHGFATVAYEEELYEPIYGRMLLPAERSGNMEKVLKRLTSLLNDNSTDLVNRIVNTLEPLLSGFLMVSIAVVLLSLMLPLIGMMNSIG